MDKNTILDYVMNTPTNTNRAVLEGMLDGLNGGGSMPLEIQMYDNGDYVVLDKTWQEIYDAMPNAIINGISTGKEYRCAVMNLTANTTKNEYTVTFYIENTLNTMTANASDDYPAHF